MYLDRDGSPRLNLNDAAGQNRLFLMVHGDQPSLSLFDAKREIRVALSVDEDGPYLYLCGATGMFRASLAVSKDGSPSPELADKSGKPRAVLGATSLEAVKTEEVTIRPESSLVLFDKDGKVMWKAP